MTLLYAQVHWPFSDVNTKELEPPYKETWQEMEKLVEQVCSLLSPYNLVVEYKQNVHMHGGHQKVCLANRALVQALDPFTQAQHRGPAAEHCCVFTELASCPSCLMQSANQS